MEVCRSSYRQNLFLDPIALYFVKPETSATRLARVLLVNQYIEFSPPNRKPTSSHMICKLVGIPLLLRISVHSDMVIPLFHCRTYFHSSDVESALLRPPQRH